MSPRKPPSDDQLRDAFSEVGDALQRAVVLSSDRLQSVFEDAVLRGRMTRRDAEELATSLMTSGREQAQELRAEVDSLARAIPGKVADVADAVAPGAKRRKRKKKAEAKAAEAKAAAETVKAKAEKKKPAKPKKPKAAAPKPSAPKAAASGLPDPSAQTARDLIALAPSLSPADAQALHTQEAAGKNRSTVLTALSKRASA